MSNRVSIFSEIGILEKVIIHSPGFEVEEMTPKTAAQVLYNDILPLPVIAEDHRELKEILKLVTKVYEVRELLRDVLENNAVKNEFIETIIRFFPILKRRREEFHVMTPEELSYGVIVGIKEKKDSLTRFLSENIFSLPPLPNLYFMRDSAIVVGDKVITGSMANKVRIMEAIIATFIYRYHPQFKSEGFILDGTEEGQEALVTVEGGDLLVLKDNVLAIGISERTTSQSIDLIINNLCRGITEPFYVFAVVLPNERATIHLDMVFTMVDKDRCVIHEPYILGNGRLPVVRITLEPNGKKTFDYMDNLIVGLKTVGLDLKPVICGGDNPLYQEREQWLSGTNFFAFEPGKFIGYDCNVKTLESLAKEGYTVKHAREFLSGQSKIEEHKKLVIGIDGAELARGGGGVRCMTMPAKRKPVKW
ncbi:MAG TPA: arginine deiminase [Firmicutes bacterium]|nr:arginine deiminase [Bacillota bacterium]